jgi:hypothetical protein
MRAHHHGRIMGMGKPPYNDDFVVPGMGAEGPVRQPEQETPPVEEPDEDTPRQAE